MGRRKARQERLHTPKNNTERNIVLAIKEFALPMALGAAALFLGAVLFFVRVNYETNDDLAMVTILSGQGGLFPAHYDSVFLNPLTGYTLYKLYSLNTGIPWYGILIYAALSLGTFLIFFVFIRYNRGIAIWLCLPALIFLFQLLSFISFTSASLLLLFGVALCLIAWLVEGQYPVENHKLFAGVLAAGFALATLLRWELVFSFLVFCLPIFFFIKKHHLRKAAACSLYGMILLGLAVWGNHLMQSREGKEFRTYDRLRAQFQDTYKGDYYEGVTPHALSRAGWSLEEYLVFRRLFFLYDSNSFNTDSLRAFLSANSPPFDSAFVKRNLEEFSRNFETSKRYSAILACIVVALLLLRYRNVLDQPKTMKVRRAASLATVSLGIVFFLFYRFPFRIFIPLYVYFLGLFFIMVNCWQKDNYSEKRLFPVAAISFLTAFAVLNALSLKDMLISGLDEAERSHMGFVYEMQKVEKTAGIGDTYLVPLLPISDCSYLSDTHPFKELDEYRVRVMPTGWMINTPYYNQILKSHGAGNGRAFLRWMANRENAFFFNVPDSQSDIPFKYVQRHIASTFESSHGIQFLERTQPGMYGGFALFSLHSPNSTE